MAGAALWMSGSSISSGGEEKRMRLKRTRLKRRYIAVLTAWTLAGSILAITGCGRNQKPVIMPKTEAGSGTGNLTGGGNGGTEGQGQGAQGQDTQAQGTQGQDAPTQKALLAVQVEAPHRYTAKLKEMHMELTADAPVIIPETSSIPVRAFTRETHTMEDYSHLRVLVEKAAGLIGKEEYPKVEKDGIVRFDPDIGSLHISFHEGDGANELPLFWVNHKTMSIGSGNGFDSWDLSGMDMGQEEKESREKKIRALGDKLVEDMGLLKAGDDSGMVLSDLQWRGTQEYSFETSKWMATGDYGIALSYQKTSDGIPIPQFTRGIANQGWSEYLDLVYTKDGQLLVMKYIDHFKLGQRKEDEFLLPFTAITEILEQYYKNYYSREDILAAMSEGYDTIYIGVNEVKLEYLTRFDDQEGTESWKGQLVPVWNFYGTMEAGGSVDDGKGSVRAAMRAHDNRSPLISIDARDGRID